MKSCLTEDISHSCKKIIARQSIEVMGAIIKPTGGSFIVHENGSVSSIDKLFSRGGRGYC